MIYGLLAALVLTNLAWLWFTYKQDQTTRAERAELLTRIQAPAEVIYQTVPSAEGPLHVPYDDDEAFHAVTSG